MSEILRVKGLGGKKTLSGVIEVNGAKNAVLQALSFSVLFKDEFKIKNVPGIEDVKRMMTLLSEIGAEATVEKNKTYSIKFGKNIKTDIPEEISKKLRASIVLTGPILARFGEVSFPHPGGCVIGARPIDLFVDGFQKLGAEVLFKDGKYFMKVKDGKLHGATIFMKNQSVTGTQTLMAAAVLAKGKTVIKNAALEPETKHLADFLNKCGAKIKGAGTSTIEIIGTGLLSAKGKTYITPPDRIETGSFLILGALAADDLEIKNCDPSWIEALTENLITAGVKMQIGKNSIKIKGNGKINNSDFNSLNIKTHEYPGFPTDIQAPMVVFLTQTTGESFIFETIFEGRLNYAEELKRMGADIKVWDPHRATVKGPTPLRGRDVESPDIRAGLAFLLAAILADGESVIHNAYFIDRGYENIEERLRNIGVDIKRECLDVCSA
ncbi:MAG: UDP-N-acetylglucosamine 1-carboxyvinyltransferase [Parcubacteria group bacterium GW2011_GWF2_38_76]|nr:MAG: UDP-N-acetylglucosamine 1-carboxyvinyltransferase [Parcubacteria group bacterium GW2011_GWF2_38_76]HBM46096.1 UDP-N-acetylglucosamine 1-carboxyvinyltransferase [Patescibacteria group bacterium]